MKIHPGFTPQTTRPRVNLLSVDNRPDGCSKTSAQTAGAVLGALPVLGAFVNVIQSADYLGQRRCSGRALAGLTGAAANLAGVRALTMGHPLLGALGLAVSSLAFVAITDGHVAA